MINIDKLADRHERLYKRHQAYLGEQTRQAVAIIADADFLRTFSGQVTWAILLNLTARLYKGIQRIRISIDADIERLPHVFFPNDLSNIRAASLRLLEDLHQGDILIEEGLPVEGDNSFIRGYVGGVSQKGVDAFSVAGRGWLAFINNNSWLVVEDGLNPIGPLTAACLGTAEIYKRLYSMRRVKGNGSMVFSAFDYSDRLESNPRLPDNIHIDKTYIAGAGAIGMALLLLLDSIPSVRSSDGLFIIDDDRLDDTNLNRCILAILDDIGIKKIEIIQTRVRNEQLKLKFSDEKWQTFAQRADHSQPHNFERVVSCVDRYEARRAVQYDKIPRVLLSAGTGDFLLTISRHILNDGLSCGLCYQTKDPGPGCATASKGSQEAFEAPIDPSIGFVSVLEGVLLGAELLKELRPEWHSARLDNSGRFYVLLGQAKKSRRAKDPNCNCSSKYVALGYENTWTD